MDQIADKETAGLRAFINGIVVIVNEEVWGPFMFPDEAMAFALRNFKDEIYKLKTLMDPDLLD